MVCVVQLSRSKRGDLTSLIRSYHAGDGVGDLRPFRGGASDLVDRTGSPEHWHVDTHPAEDWTILPDATDPTPASRALSPADLAITLVDDTIEEPAAQVYDQLIRGLSCGVARVGDRFPAVGELATRLGLAPSHVAVAYERLQDAGYVEAVSEAEVVIRSTPEATKRLRHVADELVRVAIEDRLEREDVIGTLRQAGRNHGATDDQL